jgi:hypothetical protein
MRSDTRTWGDGGGDGVCGGLTTRLPLTRESTVRVAQTELEALPTLHRAVAYVVEEMRLEARTREPESIGSADRKDF